MKRLVLLLTPLIMMSALNSCGNNYPVNAQEFDDAIHMRGVEYLQMVGDILREFSPNGYHKLIISEEEEFMCKEPDGYYHYTKEPGQTKFTRASIKESEFETIQKFVDNSIEPVKDKKFSDYQYHADSQEFTISFVVGDEFKRTVALHFMNKKIDYMRIIDDTPEKINFTYEHKDIEPPPIE